MIYIKKHDKFNDKIVAKFEECLEYDEEIVSRIFEEMWNQDSIINKDNKKNKVNRINFIKSKIYSPYYISENENPEFEIYKYKKELTCTS